MQGLVLQLSLCCENTQLPDGKAYVESCFQWHKVNAGMADEFGQEYDKQLLAKYGLTGGLEAIDGSAYDVTDMNQYDPDMAMGDDYGYPDDLEEDISDLDPREIELGTTHMLFYYPPCHLLHPAALTGAELLPLLLCNVPRPLFPPLCPRLHPHAATFLLPVSRVGRHSSYILPHAQCVVYATGLAQIDFDIKARRQWELEKAEAIALDLHHLQVCSACFA